MRMAMRSQRRAITGRALVLAGVLVLLIVVLAAPLHRYLTARGALSDAEQQRQQDQRQLTSLNSQLDQWNDPAYVEQQARARLQYALPGDTVYVVVGANQQPTLTGPAKPDSGAKTVPGQTWNQRLWGSVQAADRP